MRTCNNKDCYPICEFCKHYHANEEEQVFEGTVSKIYTGNGFCTHHSQKKEPYEVCDDFYCKDIKTKEK